MLFKQLIKLPPIRKMKDLHLIHPVFLSDHRFISMDLDMVPYMQLSFLGKNISDIDAVSYTHLMWWKN